MLWNPRAGCFGDYDPGSDCFTRVPNEQTNLFCAGHTALADGTILLAGGHRGSVDGADVGLDDTNHFIRDPFTGEWGVWVEGLPPMAMHRWYPTMTTLPDGRALVVSGSDSHCHGGPLDGEPCSESSGPDDPDSCNVCVGGGNEGAACFGDGDCDGGTCDLDGTCDIFVVETPEISGPALDPGGWTQLNVATDVPYYPLNFVLPDGTVLYAGAEGFGGGSPSIPPTETWVLDLGADPVAWTQQGNSSIPGGSAVMIAPGLVLKSGGGAPAVAGAAIYNWTTGTWTDVAPMNHARRRHQLTLLPNGTVLATGGTRSAPEGLCVGGADEGDPCDDDGDCTDGTCLALALRHNREYASSCNGGTRPGEECSSVAPLEPNCALCVRGANFGDPCAMNADCDSGICRQNANQGCPDGECIPGQQLWVAAAEIYDPATDTWTEMAAAQNPRMYHSSAMLLPDGRVVSAGSGPRGFGGAIKSYPTAEFFSPPYYFKERPVITTSPNTICYGETFRVTSPDAPDVGRVTLLRLGTTTHSFDSDQRFLELAIAGQGTDHVDFLAPDNANVAPPGYYMLFILTQDEDGMDVPSAGEYVQVVDCCIPIITIPGSVNFDDTCVGEQSKATLNVCNTGCANLEVTSIISSDPQFSVTEPSSGFPVVVSPDFCFPFQVTFAPSGTGPQSAVLAVSSNDPTNPTVQVQATGEGIEPNIASVIANNGSFGDVCLGDFKDLDVTISNSGNCALTVDDITSTSAEFDTPGVVTFPLVIGPKDSLAVPIRFEPSGPFGPRSETITIHSDDPDTPERDVAVSGNVPPGDIRVTGSTDFGQVCAEDLDAAQMPVAICNVGECNLNVSMAAVKNCTDGDGIDDFELVKDPFPAKVSPDFCIDLMVRFTPSSCGPKTCELNIMSDDPDSPVVTQVLTGNTPCASIDVPPDVCFPPTVIQAVDNCESLEPFPVSNTSKCNLTITNFAITDNPEEYFLFGLPSFPILLEKGHIAGDGDLSVGFAPVVLEPELLQREHLGEVSVTYVSDPITGDTMTETRSLCGESVRTGARVLVVHNGVPLDEVKGIRLLRINANRNRTRLDTVDVARNLPLQTVTRSADCACPDFQFHREYGTVDNPIQLLPGAYEISVMARIDGKMRRQTAGFRVGTCGFNQNIVVDF